MKDEEKLIYEWMDNLDADRAELEQLETEYIAHHSDPIRAVDTSAIARVKTRTLARLRLEQTDTALPKRLRSPRRRVIAAAVAAVLIVALGASSIPSVQAELKKVLQYVPGIGTVQEAAQGQQTFVLEKPHVHKLGEGMLMIDGIVLQSGGTMIKLRGVQTPEVTGFKAEINGSTYAFTSAMRASSGDWYGTYVPAKGVKVPTSPAITLHINGAVIGPLALVAPRTAESLEHLGSSDVQQDIRVTAFPTRITDQHIRVQLVPKLPQSGLSVQSYGVSPSVPEASLYVEDASGGRAELVKSELMTYPSDFQFQELPAGGALPYTVVIPYLEVSDRDEISSKISIPLPQVGIERSIDVQTALDGFPVRFTRLGRVSETSVILDVDLGYKPSEPRSLLSFRIRYPNSEYNNSFSWNNISPTTAVMKSLRLEIAPDQSVLAFSLAEPHYLVRGPWKLPLQLE
ncbi:hypothetical protein [Paenibacillus sp. YYML68]|uniref:hypothetical protein n=1 Tax=Paenibacillus sp. YYML68 TaxID=2909250 RepID=UPI00249115C3|nr:hypothetical protein [Paenibacillus sp. YYML68]